MTARFRCPFCGQPSRWPDRCSAALDPVCAEIIADYHALGDHRQCLAAECEGRATVEAAAVDGARCARTAGTVYAAVCLACDPWQVRSFARLQQGKPWRTRHARTHGLTVPATHKAAILIIRHDGTVM